MSSITEFDAKHGEYIVDNGWVYFEDGACRENNSYGMMSSPDDLDTPEHQRSVKQNVVRYWALRLERVTAEFQNIKREYTQHCKTAINETRGIGIAPPATVEEAVEKLEALKESVTLCRSKLEDAQEQLDSTKSDRELQREKQNEANRSDNAQLLNAIEKIEI